MGPRGAVESEIGLVRRTHSWQGSSFVVDENTSYPFGWARRGSVLPMMGKRTSRFRFLLDPRALLAYVILAIGLAGFTGSSWWFEATRDPLNPPGLKDRNVFGTSRGIRSDEYIVDLPISRAQQLAKPSFPLVNLALGLGQHERFFAPVLDWGIVFRPLMWPLLVGNRWSHGVRWFLRFAVVALGFFAWFDALAASSFSQRRDRRRIQVAAIASVAVLFSSGITWWLATPVSEILAFAGLAIFAISRRASAQSASGRWLWVAVVLYFSAVTFFIFYPPLWAPVLWLIAGGTFDLYRRARRSARLAIPGTAAVLGVVAVGVAVSIAYYTPYLALSNDTAYPGRRVNEAGAVSLARLVEFAWPSLHAYAPIDGAEVYTGVGTSNVCEAAAIEVLPLFLLVALALVSGHVRRAAANALRGRPGLVGAWALLGAWLFLPLPKSFGSLSLLRWTPGYRAWLPFGFATAILVAAVLAELATPPPEGNERRLSWPQLLVASAMLSVLFVWARVELPGGHRDSWWSIELAAALLLAGSTFLPTSWAGLALALAWAIPLVATNVSVNPLLRSQDLFHAEAGHKAIELALSEHPGRILDLDTHSGAALAAFGWPVLATVDTAPEPSLWRFLGGPVLPQEIWNRYAHVRFSMVLPTALLQNDSFVFSVNPCDARFVALGVNHFLTGQYPLPEECIDEFDVHAAGWLLLWSRRSPVSPIGYARGERPGSALAFDWHSEVAAHLVPRRDRLTFESAGESEVHYAFPLNLAIIEDIACEHAKATTIDTHVVVSPSGDGLARCDIKYLGTSGAVMRLLGRAKDFQPQNK